MNPSPRRAERFESLRQCGPWLAGAAVLGLTPKCALCLLAYAGLGAALGLGGPELCGPPAETPLKWVSALAWLGLASGIGAFGLLVNCRRSRTTGRMR